MMIITALSNNFGNSWYGAKWENDVAIVKRTVIMSVPPDFESLGDITTSTFIEKLFQQAFCHIFQPKFSCSTDDDDVLIVKWTLPSGQSPNIQLRDPTNATETSLQPSARSGREEIVRLLLENGADPNLIFGTAGMPLELAIARARGPDLVPGIVHLLLSAGSKVNRPQGDNSLPYALHRAVKQGNIELADFLIGHGAEICYEQKLGQRQHMNLTTLEAVVESSGELNSVLEVVQCVIKVFQSRAPFIRVSSLIARGALHTAAAGGNDAIVRCFFDHCGTVNYADERGITPLHMAADHGRLETCCLLLQLGAHIEMSRGFRSPLRVAACRQSPKTLDLLIANGADVNSSHSPVFKYSDGSRTTPLAIALQQRSADCAATLIRGRTTNRG